MKFIVELKEPLPRRLLRYALWTILLVGTVSLICNGVQMISHALIQSTQRASAGLLLEVSPPQAISIAEKIYRLEPSAKTRLGLLKILTDAGEWTIADALLDPVRPAADFKTLCYDIWVTSHTAPEALPALIATLKNTPQSDDERILLAKVASFVPNDTLRNMARRALHQLESDFFRDRATLLTAKIALASGDAVQARELAVKLLSVPLPPSDSVELLKICEGLKLPEANDYRSTLKISARSSLPMALALAKHFWQTQTLQTNFLRVVSAEDSPAEQKPAAFTGALPVAEFLQGLPREISDRPAARLKIAELLYKAGKRDEAVAVVEKIESPALAAALKNLLEERPLNVESKTAATPTLTEVELISAARLARDISHTPQELAFLSVLNQHYPTLWSQAEAAAAAEKALEADTLPHLLNAFAAAADNSLLVRAQAAYWQLITETPFENASYETLKATHARYADRSAISALLAFAHYRAGNLTDSLLLLPENSAGHRENFIAGVLWARAGQLEKAAAALKKVTPEKLSAPERALFEEALKKTQAVTPFKQLMDVLQTQ